MDFRVPHLFPYFHSFSSCRRVWNSFMGGSFPTSRFYSLTRFLAYNEQITILVVIEQVEL